MGIIEYDNQVLDRIWEALSESAKNAIIYSETEPHGTFERLDSGEGIVFNIKNIPGVEMMRFPKEDSRIEDTVSPGDEVWLTVEDEAVTRVREAPALTVAVSGYRGTRLQQKSDYGAKVRNNPHPQYVSG